MKEIVFLESYQQFRFETFFRKNMSIKSRKALANMTKIR